MVEDRSTIANPTACESQSYRVRVRIRVIGWSQPLCFFPNVTRAFAMFTMVPDRARPGELRNGWNQSPFSDSEVVPDVIITSFISWAVKCGYIPRRNAAAPAVIGDENDVPLTTRPAAEFSKNSNSASNNSLDSRVVILVPGANMSTDFAPQLLKEDLFPAELDEPIATIPGKGYVAGVIG